MYNLPSEHEVAAFIVGDLKDYDFICDIVIEHKSNGLRRISELHGLKLSPCFNGGWSEKDEDDNDS